MALVHSLEPVALLATITAVCACGGGTMAGDSDEEDGTGPDTGWEVGDVGGDGSCTMDLAEVVPTEQSALLEEEAGFWLWEGVIEGDTILPPIDLAQIEIWTSHGGPDGPGTYALDGSSYADCGLCVLVREGCTPQDGITRCDRDFLGISGTVGIEEVGVVGENLSGTLSDLVLVEAAIDWDGGTFASEAVPGGAVVCLDSVEFSAGVAAYPIR